MSTATPEPGEVVVRVADGPFAQPVVSRVVGMLAARAQCPVDRLDDALLVADALSAHAAEHAADARAVFRVRAREGRLELCVEDLGADGARGLLVDATLPGVGNVVERIADEVADEGDVLRIRLGFADAS